MKINMDSTKFMKKDEDVKHKDVVTVSSEGVWEESDRFTRDDGSKSKMFKIHFKLSNGEERSTTLNWTNVKLLVSAFGDETANWVGKEVRAWKTKSEKAKGGFTFLYVPTDWTRDDTGEWATGDGTPASDIETSADKDDDEIDPKDIPFD